MSVPIPAVLNNKNIILGVSGSIAAYKAVFLLRLLKKAGANVRVVTTPAVGKFVGSLSFASLSGEKVFEDLWAENWSEHVALGTWADLMVVAPATANTLAKFAHGLCDNALTAVYLAARCPVLVAPAMDADMYVHPQVSQNLKTLSGQGVDVLPVGTGFLASGLEGPGRMAEPQEIFEAALAKLSPPALPLRGKRLLVTAGPTREAIDPVRYISNHSSGKMGYALAEAARDLGAEVYLITGPTTLPEPGGLHLVHVVSAQEMFEAVRQQAEQQDILIMSAAVSDYTPRKVADQKLKKGQQDLSIQLQRTTDILNHLGQQKQAEQILVGFALETHNELAFAKEKLSKKKLDLIVLNSLKDEGAGFSHETNKITLIDRWGEVTSFPLKSKKEVARDVLAKVVNILHHRAAKQPDA